MVGAVRDEGCMGGILAPFMEREVSLRKTYKIPISHIEKNQSQTMHAYQKR